MVRVAAGFRLVLAFALALLGFAFTHVFVSGSRAAEVTTTIPKPDPPPTTSAQRTAPPPAPPPPQPQPQPVVPPPPPSPAPAPPPAPSPPVQPTPAATTAQRPAHTRHVRERTAKHLKRVQASVHFTPPRPSSQKRDAMAESAVIPPTDSSLSTTPMLVMLAIATGLSVVAVAIAMMPEWALPQSVLSAVARRRGDIVFAGITFALSIVLGLLVVLVVK
jgi:outer membrane biosynthesis protein TonB